jgi:hypothetical protein
MWIERQLFYGQEIFEKKYVYSQEQELPLWCKKNWMSESINKLMCDLQNFLNIIFTEETNRRSLIKAPVQQTSRKDFKRKYDDCKRWALKTKANRSIEHMLRQEFK